MKILKYVRENVDKGNLDSSTQNINEIKIDKAWM